MKKVMLVVAIVSMSLLASTVCLDPIEAHSGNDIQLTAQDWKIMFQAAGRGHGKFVKQYVNYLLADNAQAIAKYESDGLFVCIRELVAADSDQIAERKALLDKVEAGTIQIEVDGVTMTVSNLSITNGKVTIITD